MLMLSAAMALAMQTAPEPPRGSVLLKISRTCELRADGRRIDVNDVRGMAEQLERDARDLELRPSRHTRFECINAVIGQLRAANFSRLGFVGNEQYADDTK